MRNMILGIAVVLTVWMALAASVQPVHAGPDVGAWPMFQHDAQNSGRATVNGPQGPVPHLIWEFNGDSRFLATGVVDADGIVYVPNGKRPLTALDPDTGLELWSPNVAPVAGQAKVGLADRSQPAVSDDGRVYQGTRDNNLWATETGAGPGDVAGEIHCTFHVPHDGDVTTSPTIASDGTVYMGSEALGAGWFYAMTPDCLPKWPDGPNVQDGKVVLGGSLKNIAPALTPDESIVFVSIKTEAIAIDTADGDELWRRTIASSGFGSRTPNFSPVVSADGSAVYFVSKDGVWALDTATGAELWPAPFLPPFPLADASKEEMKSAPALAADGTLYIGASKTGSSHFYALDPADGSVLWSHEHTDNSQYINNQAAIGADGTVYVAFAETLFAFEGDGDGSGGSDIKWQMLVPGGFDAGPIVGAPGTLYVAAGKQFYKVTDPDPAGVLCAPTPDVGCRSSAPLAANLTLADKKKPSLSWKLRKGDATSTADFLDPASFGRYVSVCLYDGSALAQPITAMNFASGGQCNGKDCWRTKSKGYKLKNKSGATSRGVGKIGLREGGQGRSSVLVKGQGDFLNLPSLPLTPPVTVQLIIDDGASRNCWQSSLPFVLENDATRFKAVGP
ncbi:MAG: PQQ-binding-like beta-propeller repeat protein [Candidatus Binatia bacterium]|nr:PQQ-binding-like beta-propeller repeat protein [Candidatus Binatia bacterium]